MMAVNKAIDLTGWLSIQEVADRLGFSVRTIERERDNGKWQTRMRPRAGTKPQEVFDPQQVEARIPSPPTDLVRHSDIPTSSTPMSGLSESPAITWPALTAFLEMWIANRTPALSPVYVRLDEASRITGLSVTCLKRAIKDGKLKAVRDRAIKVRRDSLESIDLS